MTESLPPGARRSGSWGPTVRFCAQDTGCCLTPTLHTIIDSKPLIGGSGQSQRQLLSSQELGSVQFSRSVMSNSLRPYELQHARPPCLSPTPGIHSDSRPSDQWCHPAISSSVVPFSSCPQSLPASESFPMSQVNTSHEVAKVLEFQL